MTIFYGALLTAVLVYSGVRLRQWMASEGPPLGAFAFFRRSASEPAAALAGPSAKIDDLEAFSTHDCVLTDAGALKRLIDIVLSLTLMICLAPLSVLTAIAIKLDTPGPVLYRQARVGLGGEVFEVLKFRSMRVDAEKDGPQWARIRDDRITAVGRVIRKLRIDEIPQTINVLRGDMSLIGPRPERPEFVAVLEEKIPNYHSRHLVKPGITGWAQVKHQYTASIDGAREKLKYDLYYVSKTSPLLDLQILLLTVRVVLLGIGSR